MTLWDGNSAGKQPYTIRKENLHKNVTLYLYWKTSTYIKLEGVILYYARGKTQTILKIVNLLNIKRY